MSRAWHEQTALELGAGIASGAIDAVELTEHFLARIAEIDKDHAIYLRTTPARARAEAEAARKRAKAGARLSPLDGVPISWKDLFDTVGDATSHGSLTLMENIARKDALLVERLTRAGTVCLGKTNQTEFAYSILGLNPTLGTPANAFDAKTPRVPGGSSSGAAVSVARGLAAGAIGSDTGGSVRSPAAWNGLFGLKPTFGRLPLDGALALAPSLDSAGPLTRDAADAAALFSLMDGRFGAGSKQPVDLGGASAAELRLLAPRSSILWREPEDGIGEVVEAALAKLAKAGARITEGAAPELDEAHELLVKHGPYHAAEAYAIWKDTVEARPNLVYRLILERMRMGANFSAATVEVQKAGLKALGERISARMAAEGAIVSPTMALSPPLIEGLADDNDRHGRTNLKGLRNTRLGNFLGLCAITVPCGRDRNGIPVGLMVMGAAGWDERLLRMGKAIEVALAG